jgi:hypothetical protein
MSAQPRFGERLRGEIERCVVVDPATPEVPEDRVGVPVVDQTKGVGVGVSPPKQSGVI